MNAFLASEARYSTDPEYRAEVDAERDRRQADVNAKMDAGIARHRATKGQDDD